MLVAGVDSVFLDPARLPSPKKWHTKRQDSKGTSALLGSIRKHTPKGKFGPDNLRLRSLKI